MAKLLELVGIAGVSLILYSFYRLTIGGWTSKSLWYQLNNLLGALLLSVYSWYKHAYVTILLNIVWAGVATIGVESIYERHQRALQRRQRRRKQR